MPPLSRQPRSYASPDRAYHHQRQPSATGSASGDRPGDSGDYYGSRRRSRRPRTRSRSPPPSRDPRDRYDDLPAYRDRSPARSKPRDLSLAPWQTETAYPEYEARSVICTHLPPPTTARDLGEFFEANLGSGLVVDVAIAQATTGDKMLGGFVELSHQKLVPKALGLTGLTLYGAPIRVEPTEAARLATFRRSDMFLPPAFAAAAPAASDPSPAPAPAVAPAPAPGPQAEPSAPGTPPHAAPPAPTVSPSAQAAGLGAPSGSSSKTAARLYVGSLAYEASTQEVKSVFERYGEVEYVDLHREPDTGKSKGFCFVQYKDPEAASRALTHLDGYDIRGRAIKVGRVTTPGSGSRPGLPAYGSQNAGPSGAYDETGRPLNAPSAPGGPATGDQDGPATTVLLQHMFNPAEEEEKDWDLDMARDVRQECEAQYGAVLDIFVDKESQGDIHVIFEDPAGAAEAIAGLNGRLFGGNYIQARLMPRHEFGARALPHPKA